MTSSKSPHHIESFAERWSRKKQLAERSDGAGEDERADMVEDALTDEALSGQEINDTTRAEEKAELNALRDEDMPALDSLDEDSDFAQFMSTSVSEGLRKLALRKLFHSESFNLRDGLDEYDGDYTYFEKLDPTTITSDMKHIIEVQAEKQKQLEAQISADQESTSEGTDASDSERAQVEKPEQAEIDSQQLIKAENLDDDSSTKIVEEHPLAEIDQFTNEESS